MQPEKVEIWKVIPGFEGYYEASSLGQIRSIRRKVDRKHPIADQIIYRYYGGKILKQHKLKNCKPLPYLYLTLSKDNFHYRFLVHRLILMTFVGGCPNGQQACHNDGNRLNNNIDNLRWDTASNNQLDRHKHGTNNFPVFYGSNNRCAKLNEDDVLKIRSTPYSKTRAQELSIIYGVTKSNIWQILSGRSWKHI